MAACSLKPYFRGVGKNELINEGHAQGAFRRTVSQSNLKALSQILQVNSMLTMGREVAAPDIAERADDFEYHCRKAEAPVEG